MATYVLIPGAMGDSWYWHYFEALYDVETMEWSEKVASSFPDVSAISRDLLILDILEIVPTHREKRVGLASLWHVMRTFGTHRGLIACQPYPMQFGSRREGPAWLVEMGKGLSTDKNEGTAKLRRYWKRLGFQQIRGTEYFGFCPANEPPPLAS